MFGFSTLHLGQLVRDRLGSAPNDRDLCLSPGAVVWEGRSAWKALGPMPWFSKWVRPLGWGVLEQGHAALARLGRDGRNGKIEEGWPGLTLSSVPSLLGKPFGGLDEKKAPWGLEYPLPS